MREETGGDIDHTHGSSQLHHLALVDKRFLKPLNIKPHTVTTQTEQSSADKTAKQQECLQSS